MTETTQDQNKKKQHRQVKKVENPEWLSTAMKVVGNEKIAELSNRKVRLVKKGELHLGFKCLSCSALQKRKYRKENSAFSCNAHVLWELANKFTVLIGIILKYVER